jgi:hypothetical protein
MLHWRFVPIPAAATAAAALASLLSVPALLSLLSHSSVACHVDVSFVQRRLRSLVSAYHEEKAVEQMVEQIQQQPTQRGEQRALHCTALLCVRGAGCCRCHWATTRRDEERAMFRAE